MEKIYVVRRKKYPDLILSRYSQRRNLTEGLDGKTSSFVCSSPPLEDMDDCVRIIYADIDSYITAWIADSRYIFRLLVSAGVFLAVYFVMSIALRDPLPLLDEMLLGILAALLAWRALARRDEKSQNISHTRLRLKKQIEARAETSDAVALLETFLEKAEASDLLSLADYCAGISSRDMSFLQLPLEMSDIQTLLRYLEGHLELQERTIYRNYRRACSLKGEDAAHRFSSLLVHEAQRRSSDLSLLALAITLYRTAHVA